MTHDDLDPVFHDVFGASDPAPIPSLDPLNLDYRYSPPESAREKVVADQLVARINFEHFAETVLGAEPEPIFPNAGEQRIGLNGTPITFGKANSMDELENSFRRLIKAVQEGVRRGDPETLAFLNSGRRVERFRKRLSKAADDFTSDCDPSMRQFLKAWASGDQAGMREFVRAELL